MLTILRDPIRSRKNAAARQRKRRERLKREKVEARARDDTLPPSSNEEREDAYTQCSHCHQALPLEDSDFSALYQSQSRSPSPTRSETPCQSQSCSPSPSRSDARRHLRSRSPLPSRSKARSPRSDTSSALSFSQTPSHRKSTPRLRSNLVVSAQKKTYVISDSGSGDESNKSGDDEEVYTPCPTP